METKMVKTSSAHKISSYKLEGKKEDLRKSTTLWIKRRFNKRTYRTEKKLLKDGAYYCYCAYVLRISRYSDFLSPMLTNTGIFLRGLKLSGESRP